MYERWCVSKLDLSWWWRWPRPLVSYVNVKTSLQLLPPNAVRSPWCTMGAFALRCQSSPRLPGLCCGHTQMIVFCRVRRVHPNHTALWQNADLWPPQSTFIWTVAEKDQQLICFENISHSVSFWYTLHSRPQRPKIHSAKHAHADNSITCSDGREWITREQQSRKFYWLWILKVCLFPDAAVDTYTFILVPQTSVTESSIFCFRFPFIER